MGKAEYKRYLLKSYLNNYLYNLIKIILFENVDNFVKCICQPSKLQEKFRIDTINEQNHNIIGALLIFEKRF